MESLSAGDRIVSSKERRHLIPYSDMHVWRMEQAGRFPKRIRLGGNQGNRIGWSYRELQEWIAARKNERDNAGEADASLRSGTSEADAAREADASKRSGTSNPGPNAP